MAANPSLRRSEARLLGRFAIFVVYQLRQLLDKFGETVGKRNLLHGFVIGSEPLPEMCSYVTATESALQQC